MILILWNNQSHGIVLVKTFQNNHLNEIFFMFLFPGVDVDVGVDVVDNTGDGNTGKENDL